MELIYLWVEEYKNIRKQGFNFSGRYRCEYDKKKNELTINENKEYVHIFPDNINVTAIVGKNGSGKSSLVKIILMLIFYKKNQFVQKIKPIETEKKQIAKMGIANNFYDKFFLIVKLGNGFRKLVIGEKYKFLPYPEIDSIDFFSIHFNYMLDTLYDGFRDEWVKNVYHRNDGYSTPILLEPYKNANNEEKIDLKIIEYLNNQRMLKFYSQITAQNDITRFFNPNKIKIVLAQLIAMKLNWHKKTKGKGFDYIDELGEVGKLEDKFRRLQITKGVLISNDFTKNVLNQIRKLYTDNEYIKINNLYIALKALSSDKDYFFEAEYDAILKNFQRKTSTYNKQNYIDILINFDANKLLKRRDTYEVAKIEKCIEFAKKYADNNFKIKFDKAINSINKIDEIKDIFETIPPWLEVEFFQNEKSIKSLSSGEKGFFSFIINTLYQMNNISHKSEYSTINLFLDETDVGFHPEWQRKYVDDVLFAITPIWKKKINIIFLTHSPFLLSDIPSDNIVFLDKDSDGKCHVANGLQDKKQTFGANIHTLLSDAFFMEDGLMGEYAKSKINKAIELLNKQGKLSRSSMKYCEEIISIIGEPILKKQLQRMLDSKRLSKIDEIDLLKTQMSEIQQKIKKLEGGK